jgi:hypothetical protein
MRTTRLVLPVLLGLAPALALAGCSDSTDGSSHGGPVEVSAVGDGFTFETLSVADGWTLEPVERSAGMESVTSPEISGRVTNEGEEPAYALFEMVFARDGEKISTVRCSSPEIEPGGTVDLTCPGLGAPMPEGHDQIVVQEITR